MNCAHCGRAIVLGAERATLCAPCTQTFTCTRCSRTVADAFGKPEWTPNPFVDADDCREHNAEMSALRAAYTERTGRPHPRVYRVRVAVEAEELSDEEAARVWREARERTSSGGAW